MPQAVHPRPLPHSLPLTLAATLLASALLPAVAQADWPDKPIEVIVPYTPGGATDAVTRIVMDKLAQRLGVNVIVQNRPGANSTIGTAQLARANPDGYTFGTVLAAFAVNPHLYPLTYDSSDFAPVSHMADLPLFLFVNNELPVTSVEELVAYGRANPDTLSYGSSGTGSSAHMTGANFGQQAGITMTHIPYRGSAPMLTDLLGGQVSFTFDPILVPMPHAQQGKLKVLAVTSRERWAEHPEIPTMEESGFPGFVMNSWVSLLAPKGTPPEIVEAMSGHIAEIVQEPDVRQRFTDAGFVPVGSSPADLSALIANDTAMYQGIVEKGGITVN